LGKELGRAVRHSVDGSLPTLPDRLLQEAWRDLFDPKNLPSSLAIEFEKSGYFVAAEIDFADGSDFRDPNYPDMMNDAGKIRDSAVTLNKVARRRG
jgi:hypothetical protein